MGPLTHSAHLLPVVALLSSDARIPFPRAEMYFAVAFSSSANGLLFSNSDVITTVEAAWRQTGDCLLDEIEASRREEREREPETQYGDVEGGKENVYGSGMRGRNWIERKFNLYTTAPTSRYSLCSSEGITYLLAIAR